jgi:hypothetical protein
MKTLDPQGFDEDLNYRQSFINNPEWDEVRKKWKLREDVLAQIVAGEGLLGSILDVADKMTYTAHDVPAFLGGHFHTDFSETESPTLRSMHQKYTQTIDPLCALWEDVGRRGNRIYFKDPCRLAEFLDIRAVMFAELYNNPKARYRDQMVITLVADALFREGTLTREQLLTGGDEELDRLIDAHCGCPISWANTCNVSSPRVREFSTREDALEDAEAVLKHDSKTFLMVEEFRNPSLKAVQYLVLDNKNALVPFREAHPELAAPIIAKGEDSKPVKLYILDVKQSVPTMPESTRELVLKWQRVRLGLN